MADLGFDSGPARIRLDAAGGLVAVTHRARPDRSFLDGGGRLRPGLDGPVTGPEVAADLDEVELTWRCGPLRWTVRHTFVAGWGLRLTLVNEGADALELADPVLEWRTPPDQPAWAVAAGASAGLTVLAPSGEGPVLTGRLRLGAVTRVDTDGLHLGPVRLAPGGRYTVAWLWEVVGRRGNLDRTLHPDVPAALDLAVDEVTAIQADPDQALLPSGLETETVRDRVELSSGVPGRFDVEIRSARGTTAYEVRVAPPLPEVLAAVAADVLAGRRTPSGVVRLADVDAALVLQRVRASGGLPDLDAAEEALELFTARLPEVVAEPRVVGLLCGEHARTGDPETLQRAEDAVLAADRVRPGLGLVAAELGLALLLAGRPVAPVLEHLAALAAAAPDDPSPTAQAALLELEVLTPAHGRRAAGSDPSLPRSLVRRVSLLGGWLGAGLKGRAVRPAPVGELAHQAAVLALLPEPVSAAFRLRWGCSVHELAARVRVEVLARLDERPGPARHRAETAHGWLVLGTRSD